VKSIILHFTDAAFARICVHRDFWRKIKDCVGPRSDYDEHWFSLADAIEAGKPTVTMTLKSEPRTKGTP